MSIWNQEIRTYRLERGSREIFKRGEVIPKSRMARFAKWLLDKTKHDVTVSFSEPIIERRVEINISDVRDMIEEVMDARAWEMVWRSEVDRILVGHKHFDRFLAAVDQQPLTINVDFRLTRAHREAMMCGIDVQFVPWIDGFVIVPKKGLR